MSSNEHLAQRIIFIDEDDSMIISRHLPVFCGVTAV
jgi:hypothetical protein